MDSDTDAVAKFLDGHACSQAIVSRYCSLTKLENSTAIRLAAGFGAGMQMGRTCGALTGAYMVLGLMFATEDSATSAGRKEVNKAVAEFTRRFVERNKTTECKELLGCDVNTEHGSRVAREKELFSKVCPKFVRDCEEILSAMLVDKNEWQGGRK